jgi:dipeptidyl-peptidase-4
MQAVPLWFNPEYPGLRPLAEYHPGAEWLRAHGRSTKLLKGIEFYNIKKFREEIERMPSLALHELSHAFHDQELSYDQPDIIAAYKKAKASGKYDLVERRHGSGETNTKEMANAMSNHTEYFAECTEAFFLRNDFYPFNREDLHNHDPEMEQVLIRLWKCEKLVEDDSAK